CEPNNSFSAAYNLGATNRASIGGLTVNVATDLDYFKFTAASSQLVSVRIDFNHVQGNLQLAAYNASQQLITSSNSSTPQNGSEAVQLNVSAGQIYYIKVSGVGGAMSPWYDLTMKPLSVTFDWTMPARFGNQLDQWGLPVIPNTVDYARPNPVMIQGEERPTYPVRLDASGTDMGSNSVVYQWYIYND